MKFLVFTRLPDEDYWVYAGDCYDASEVDELCRILRKTAREGKLYVKIEAWPDEEVKDLCKGRGRS